MSKSQDHYDPVSQDFVSFVVWVGKKEILKQERGFTGMG
jgi:hypothetical protein